MVKGPAWGDNSYVEPRIAYTVGTTTSTSWWLRSFTGTSTKYVQRCVASGVVGATPDYSTSSEGIRPACQITIP